MSMVTIHLPSLYALKPDNCMQWWFNSMSTKCFPMVENQINTTDHIIIDLTLCGWQKIQIQQKSVESRYLVPIANIWINKLVKTSLVSLIWRCVTRGRKVTNRKHRTDLLKFWAGVCREKIHCSVWFSKPKRHSTLECSLYVPNGLRGPIHSR